MYPEPTAGARGDAAASASWPRRVLVVARWYPAHDDPGRGSFVSDEVAALQAAGIEVVVASWENAEVRSRNGDVGRLVGAAVGSWGRVVVHPASTGTPLRWGAGAPVARLPVPHRGGHLPTREEIDAHAALLVPFATALAARWPFDMVHAHVGIPDGAAAARVATALGVPLLVTEHASDAPERLKEEAARRGYRELLEGGRRVVAVSRALAARLEDSLGLPPGTVPVVPNIIPFDQFPLGDAAHRDPDELLWVGARREHKGIDVLIRAVAIARERRPGLHLRLVGRAPDLATDQRWHELAEEVGLAGAIAFEPPTDRAGVAAAMRHAGIFVHPSPYETFGMVAAEALAAGLPVAARRSGGVEEVLAGQDAGAELADRDDAAALAAAILRLRSRSAEIDPAAIRAAVIRQFPEAGAIAAIVGHARNAAAELAPSGRRPFVDRSAVLTRIVGATGDGVWAGRTADLPPVVLVVGLHRATTVRRLAALPVAVAARLAIVTRADSAEDARMLPPFGQWIEVDSDAVFVSRLAALGGPLDPRRTAIQRLATALAHPRRTMLRLQLARRRPSLRTAAEREAVLAAWRRLTAGARTERALVVAIGVDDVVLLADVLAAGGRLAPGGLRWLVDAWDAARRP